MVDTDNHEINPVQTHQTSMPVTAETLDDNKPEYRGSHFHFHVPSQDAQHTVQNLNQGVQMPPPYPGAPFVVAPPLVYLGEPYAPYEGQYGHTVGQIVILGMMYPPQVYP